MQWPMGGLSLPQAYCRLTIGQDIADALAYHKPMRKLPIGLPNCLVVGRWSAFRRSAIGLRIHVISLRLTRLVTFDYNAHSQFTHLRVAFTCSLNIRTSKSVLNPDSDSGSNYASNPGSTSVRVLYNSHQHIHVDIFELRF